MASAPNVPSILLHNQTIPVGHCTGMVPKFLIGGIKWNFHVEPSDSRKFHFSRHNSQRLGLAAKRLGKPCLPHFTISLVRSAKNVLQLTQRQRYGVCVPLIPYNISKGRQGTLKNKKKHTSQ